MLYKKVNIISSCFHIASHFLWQFKNRIGKFPVEWSIHCV